jgi:hypothetical protein
VRYAQCKEAVGNGRSDLIFGSLLLVSRVEIMDLMLVRHGICIISAGVIVAHDQNTVNFATRREEQQPRRYTTCAIYRSSSTDSDILQQPHSAVPDDHNQATPVIPVKSKCVMAAPATAWRQHIDNAG